MKKSVAGINRREFLKKAGMGSLALAALPALGHTLATPAEAHGQTDHVRWDIVSVDIPITTLSPGGVAYASAGNPTTLKIKLMGHGTFVAPASGGTSHAVTGGGTWETFNGATSTGHGMYKVTGLASWQFANFQAQVFIDHVGDTKERANGNAVLLIEYSDGKQGILGIGCHGPGAPDGIIEGVIASKGYVTYWNSQPPSATVDANRTLFHVRRHGEGDE